MTGSDINFIALRQQLIRSIRGTRSQNFVNRCLKVKYNKVHGWEKTQKTVPWADFVKFLKSCHVSPEKAAAAVFFYGDLSDGTAIYNFLSKGYSKRDLTKKLSVSRMTLNRWANGDTVPSVDDFLKMFHFLNQTLDIFLGAVTDVSNLEIWSSAHRRRRDFVRLHREFPNVGAALRAFETTAYLSSPGRKFPAARIGVTQKTGDEILKRLVDLQLVEWKDDRYQVTSEAKRLDTTGVATDVMSYWFGESSRMFSSWRDIPKDRCGGVYSVLSCSAENREEIRKIVSQFYQEIKGLVEEPRPGGWDDIIFLGVTFFDPQDLAPLRGKQSEKEV